LLNARIHHTFLLFDFQWNVVLSNFEDPDSEGGANEQSLNQARAAYKVSRKSEAVRADSGDLI
jgi:hypothetical protein